MKAKTVLTIVLLAFVASALGTLVAKSLRPSRATDASAGQLPPSDGLIAYYFHSNTRCPTCMTIESYAHEALQSDFGKEMKSGRLQWRVLNYEQPENDHLVKEFEIALPSVVLVRMAGGKQVAWKNLDQVWPLVGDKRAFLAYLRKEVQAMMDTSAGSGGPETAGMTPTDRIVVYCFQGKARDPMSMTIESYAKVAVETGFTEQLKSHRLQWKVVNYEEPGNEHYAAQFKLTAPCVVVARMHGAEQVEWRSLPEVRELCSDKQALVKFVQRNVKEFLDYITIPGACCL
jgi:hypothetical protein